jgi:8-oxo-dGTP pyrophosphatase MutT (NUDIX family)
MPWKTLNTKEVYRNKWMWITEDKVVTDFGVNLTYGVIHKKPFALIIPWDGKNFTLVGQYRYAIKKFSWEFPKGGAAKAELREETGLSASSIKLIGSFFLAPGHHSQRCKVFLAQDLTEGKQKLEKSEKGMKTKKISRAGLEKMIANGKMKDGPTLAALSIFNNYLK